ncbi:DHHW family protein [Paenibacillus tyrfis]|uniref:DHHW family protein n=1 Tax=Paenibacillus tyrfis TaxID=1501230 RepID=UPI0024937BE6|nr:DHHW family protein [Paenibacillus tyrfis]
MNKYAKRSQSINIAMLLLLFLGGVLMVNLFKPSKSFSEAENRSLEQLPPLSLHSLVSGKFTSGFEKYISDQFMARDFWIGVKSDADRAMGKKESNGVYLGKDGYLIQKFTPPADGDMEMKVNAIHSLAKAAPGLRTFVMLVPTAASVLADKLPDYAPAGEELAYLDQVGRSLHRDIRFVDVYPALRAQQERSVYYKTDHHWTTRGAFYAYQELSKRMGLTPKKEEDFTIRTVTDEFYGSLYSKSGFRHVEPDSIELYMPKAGGSCTVEYVEEGRTSDSMYAMDNLGKKDKYTVFFDGNHSLIRITTGLRNGTKLLVIKDSYANSLIPFLTPHFSEIYVVDPRYYEKDLKALIQERHIRDVLLLYNANTFFEDPSLNQLAEPTE